MNFNIGMSYNSPLLKNWHTLSIFQALFKVQKEFKVLIAWWLCASTEWWNCRLVIKHW